MTMWNPEMKIRIRKFEERDVQAKVDWINNPEINKYLHYDLPLEYEKTLEWYRNIKDRQDRYDGVIEFDGTAVGLIGLLSIDKKSRKAELYTYLCDLRLQGRGIAKEAARLLTKYAFTDMGLEKIYAYVETGNISAQRHAESVGYVKEGLLKRDLFYNGRYIDRYLYGRFSDPNAVSGGSEKSASPVCLLTKNDGHGNRLYIKRDDLIPYCFGGNKSRKAELFFREFDEGGYDCVVTYGSGESNHCRVVANMCAARGVKCFIISPEETEAETLNNSMMRLFGAEIQVCPVTEVSKVIDNKLHLLRSEGASPYFIHGGGHGNTGTQAYVDCYNEIREYERETGIFFDYIFHASGTGTTQAGLVCGKLIGGEKRKIVGLSIARKNPHGAEIVRSSVEDYLAEHSPDALPGSFDGEIIFIDRYVGDGYGKSNDEIDNTVKTVMARYGVPLDSTYTGKAFWGMSEYIAELEIKEKNILFIHTGGTPIFFDDLRKKR